MELAQTIQKLELGLRVYALPPGMAGAWGPTKLGQIGAEATAASGEPPEPQRFLQFNIAPGKQSVNRAEVQCSARATAPRNASEPVVARVQRVIPQGNDIPST